MCNTKEGEGAALRVQMDQKLSQFLTMTDSEMSVRPR